MRVRRDWLALAVAVGLGMNVAAAQGVEPVSLRGKQAAPAYSIAGTIVDVDAAPVSDASVEVLEVGAAIKRLRSDSAGRFLASGLATRSVTVRVRRVGYQPRAVPVSIPAGDERTAVVITLEAAPTELGPTTIVADEEPGQRLREFYERMATNKFGSYIEPKTIEKRRPTFVSEMLRSVPGVRVRPSGGAGNAVTIRGCSPVIWIDGARMVHAELDDVVQASDVSAIEVYRSFSGIPAEYFDRAATCGTILVWTKLQ